MRVGSGGLKQFLRYGAIGLAFGLLVSLVLGSWVFAAINARSRTIAGELPQLLAGVVSAKLSLGRDFDRSAPRFATDETALRQLSARLRDTSVGLAALAQDLPSASDERLTATRVALEAQRAQFDSLADVLGSDPFAIPSEVIDRAKDVAWTAKTSLENALQIAGVTFTGGDWSPTQTLDEMVALSERLSRAARNTQLSVESHTQSTVVLRWSAQPVADWTGLWLILDGGPPILVTDPTYVIDGLEPGRPVSVVGSLALGQDGRYRGPATDALEVTAGDPPLSEAWLGDQFFGGAFTITSETYDDAAIGKQVGGGLRIDSTCDAGTCQATVSLTYPLFEDGAVASGTATWSGGSYTLKAYGVTMGVRSATEVLTCKEGCWTTGSRPCFLTGERTITFTITDAEMIDGVWTATAIAGTVEDYSKNCNPSDPDYVASRFQASR